MPTLATDAISVLLIEDDHEDRAIIQRYLNRCVDSRFKVTWVKGLRDCQRKVSEIACEVVLMDFRLEDCTALELIEQLPYSIRRLPIVLFTRYGNESVDRRAMELGVEFFLDKQDLNERVLERTIRYAIRNKELQNRLLDFTAVVTHDLSGPLRGIGNALKLLLNEDEDSVESIGLDRSEIVQMASKESSRLQRLVRELSRYAQANRTTLNRRPVELNVLLSETLDLLKSEIERREATVEAGDLPTVYADPDILVHVFQNLIQNALKFVDGRKPSVRVTCESRIDRCSIAFADNGIGFDPAQAERIFQPLYRLHGRSRFEGSGLGLAICREFVEKHDGRIWAESIPGEGSTFFIELPLAVPFGVG